MKKLFFLVFLFITLTSCGNTNIFNGDLTKYTNEVTEEEWKNKRNEYLSSLDILDDNYIRDLSCVVKFNESLYIDDKRKSENETVENISYDAESKVLAIVYNNDFSTRYCLSMSNEELYSVKIVNLQIVNKEKIDGDENTISFEARKPFKSRIDAPLFEIEKVTENEIIKYYIDDNILTVTVLTNKDDADNNIDSVYQYVFTEKYVCLNFSRIISGKKNDESYKMTTKYASYILFEEVEIEPIF